MIVSLSTCWNSRRHKCGAEMLREIESLGFDYAELSHGLRMTMMPGILDHMKTGRIKISSVHNYCPQPVDVMGDSPDCLEFTHYDPLHRQRAVRMSCETVSFAARVGAPVAVLHLGSMPHPDFESGLADMAACGEIWTRAGIAARLRGIGRRDRVAEGYFKRVTDCLDPIAAHAREKGVKLGFETRSSALELPAEEQFAALLERYGEDAAGYWHDFGHVQMKENLSLANHWEQFSRHAPRLVGAHVHQTVFPDRDHRPLDAEGGTVDFPTLLAAAPRSVPWVLELSSRATAESVVASRKILCDLLNRP